MWNQLHCHWVRVFEDAPKLNCQYQDAISEEKRTGLVMPWILSRRILRWCLAPPLKTRETSYETTCEISVSKISMEHAGECHISMPIQQLNGTLGQSNMDKNRQAQTTGIEISSADHRINSRRQWKTGKVSGMWQRWTRWVWREENIIFDKRCEVASSTSHKNAARVPASPPDIQPLRLSLCWAEVHSRSISCLSQV